ncbi:NAD-binding protein [Mycobacterium sp. pR1184]|uniref:NAD-binding protein n=1 Tax=Mycobacterium sp. pR1184 TaxID=3238981 RepID=UPI00351BB68A
MHGHIIVSGEDALATTIAEELENAGATVVKLVDDTVADTKDDLVEAGIVRAAAVVCAGDDDAINLEIALLARQANPNVRVVARLANDVLREAVSDDNGPGAILDVAELAAPSVVEACLAHTAHPFEAAGIEFLVSNGQAPYDATLREIYADLAPVAVIHGKNSPAPGLLETCPGRDLKVRSGDWTAMIGTVEELASRGIKAPRPNTTRIRQRRLRRAVDVARGLRNDVNPMFMRAVAAVLTVLIGSTVLLRYCYQPQAKMTWVDALYFSTETIATVGYGDFSFLTQPTWLRLFSIGLMFGGLMTTAVLVAFIADLLISRRFAHTAGRRRARHLRNHVVVVGLGSFGSRVVADLTAAGYEVAVIEIDENNRYLSAAAEVPVIFGDATLRQTLEAARVDTARAIAVLTHDDMTNIETGIVLREMLGPRVLPHVIRPDVPIVLRIYDRALGNAVADRFGFNTVRSTVELAAPWFIGAAMGLQVLGTFSVGQRYFMIGGMHVAAGSELDGMVMFELSTQTRVIAITRDDTPVQLHPRRDARLRAGDTVYLVGPYRELVATLQKGQPPQPEVGRERLPA